MGKGGQTNGGENGEKQNGNKDLIILRTHIHCEGCASDIIKSLRGFEGVEDVRVVSDEHKVLVKGKHADPLQVLERVRAKCPNKHVELISPKLKPPAPPKKLEEDENEPLVMIIVIQVFIHCENCAQETKTCIERMKGVQMVTVDVKKKQMTVVGAVEPQYLVDYLHKRAGKHVTVVKHEYQDKEKAKKRLAKQYKNGNTNPQGDGEKKKEEKVKDIYYHYPPQYEPDHLYPCLLLNDENPEACIIM
uniref:HMA domain-containing protein n=1 Tax=Kalanchoe fedtschenkoi TaxID=63787 RepID=A0A7N0US17_KALFE